MSKDNYTNEELKFFNKLERDLIVWMFDYSDKRYCIAMIIREAYEKGRKQRDKTK